MLNTPTYRSWMAMKTRCYNRNRKDWPLYGGKGIAVCDRWKDNFLNFLTDMGLRPNNMTIDRIDSDGDYCPENCRWASNKVQAMNKRHTKKIEFNGIIDSICGWAKRLGVRHTMIARRLDRGWSVKDALTVTALKIGQKRKIGPNTRLVTLENRKVSVFIAARLLNIPYSTVTERIGRGWTIREALNDRIE